MEEIRNCIWQGVQVTQDEFNKLAGITPEPVEQAVETAVEAPVKEVPVEETPVEVKQTAKRGRKKAESEE